MSAAQQLYLHFESHQTFFKGIQVRWVSLTTQTLIPDPHSRRRRLLGSTCCPKACKLLSINGFQKCPLAHAVMSLQICACFQCSVMWGSWTSNILFLHILWHNIMYHRQRNQCWNLRFQHLCFDKVTKVVKLTSQNFSEEKTPDKTEAAHLSYTARNVSHYICLVIQRVSFLTTSQKIQKWFCVNAWTYPAFLH